MSDPFAAASDLAQLVGINDPPDLARSQMFLELASASIRRYCGQTLSPVAGDVVVLEPVERTTLLLPERPVTAITTLVANGVTLSPTTDYYFTRAGLIHSGIRGASGTNWSYGATVTYTHGYDEETEEYKAIKVVALNIVQRILYGPQGEVFGPERVEAIGWSAEIRLTDQEQMLLRDFGKVMVS